MYSIETLSRDLKKLGVVEGDTLLVRADLGKIGKLESKKEKTILTSFFML